nr:NUDIX domain-containing protein [Pectobacterium colocasium]
MLARCYAVDGWPGKKEVEKKLWARSEEVTPAEGVSQFNQAMMDYRRNGLYPQPPQVRAVPAQHRLYCLRQPQLGAIPGKKPKQTLPEKTGWFLLMQQGSQVWLQQRPAVGLWGGLFCFPQFSERRELELWLQQRGLNPDGLQQLVAFRHTFSHFHLDIVPLWLDVSQSDRSQNRSCMDDDAGSLV